MGKSIKTREIVKDVKVHDAAVNVGDRMKNIGVKTKDTINENIKGFSINYIFRIDIKCK